MITLFMSNDDGAEFSGLCRLSCENGLSRAGAS